MPAGTLTASHLKVWVVLTTCLTVVIVNFESVELTKTRVMVTGASEDHSSVAGAHVDRSVAGAENLRVVVGARSANGTGIATARARAGNTSERTAGTKGLIIDCSPRKLRTGNFRA